MQQPLSVQLRLLADELDLHQPGIVPPCYPGPIAFPKIDWSRWRDLVLCLHQQLLATTAEQPAGEHPKEKI